MLTINNPMWMKRGKKEVGKTRKLRREDFLDFIKEIANQRID